MSAEIKTYKQDRPKDWLRENPQETWRCDIFPKDGSDHHGVGETESVAILHAAAAYVGWQHGRTPTRAEAGAGNGGEG
jgi:hypothetical protein